MRAGRLVEELDALHARVRRTAAQPGREPLHVDERLGTLGDFVDTLRVAGDRGIRVIADLVVNHTSDRHPWFREARADRSSPYRDYYVWRDEPCDAAFDQIIFPDAEDSNWEWDEEAGQYYLHRFYAHQPDLNIAEQRVRDEIAEIIGFWMRQGIAGFRVDAVPYLLETDGIDGLGADASDGAGATGEASTVEPHDFLRDLRRLVGRRRGDAALLGEVNLAPEDQRRYFGETGDELQLVFNFHVNQHLWLAMARRNAEPLRAALDELPEIPAQCSWANFVRSHDEVNVGRLTEQERQEVFAAFAPDESMRIFDRGIRRRLAPMLDGDHERIAMVYSLLFSLPGTPVIYYGEELGMGENLDMSGRHAVRSPMQWTPDDNGGFSTLPVSELVRTPPSGRYGPAHVNVADQRPDGDSLLNWMGRLVRRRRETPEFGWGDWRPIDTDDPRVLALEFEWHGRGVAAVHNLGDEPVSVALDVDHDGRTHSIIEGRADAHCDGERISVALGRYGHTWLRVRSPDRRRLW